MDGAVGYEDHGGVDEQDALAHTGGAIDCPPLAGEFEVMEYLGVDKGAAATRVFDGVVDLGVPEGRDGLPAADAAEDF
jgi:hypothetical protein